MTTRKFAIARAVGIIGATAALVTGVTFAAFTSTATLSDNTISTATAGLEINGHLGSQPGFTLTGYVPGTNVTVPFTLTNSGGVPLAVTAQVVPGVSFANVGVTDYSKVSVTITNTVTTNHYTTDFGTLLTGFAIPELSNMPAGSSDTYNATLNIDPSGVTGTTASLSDFDIVFTGTQP